MDLASARGTKISDIVIDHRPSTGRGKKLTLAQEGVLKRLYEQKLPSVPDGELPAKGFWVNLASQFREQTGREYSWLSVKRRAAGWRQKSLEIDHRLDASELGVEDSELEPSHQNIARGSPSQQDSRDSEQPPLPPSKHQRDSSTLELSELEKSPGVGYWLQRSWFPSATDPSPDTSKSVRSTRMAQARPRSRSPNHVSQPGYRRRSPTTSRTKSISKRLHQQLASSSNGLVASGTHPWSGSPAHEDVQLSHLSTRKPHESNRIHGSVENESESHARDSGRSKHEENKVSTGLLASPHLSEQDDLPLAPTRIKRRRVAK
ncbi:hypothetical protein N7519_010155 [Penicillium mononematosum]|uniref:uncharacterized protein n=1 Tax=Penicillium mononematosum TaxID=268346 RepID=UPI002548DBA5|nr:uncharacterized protein N7519_010155 [Penicillium mononematosum]KAJ6179694.1 hypothetical protein N7519_010155 [Penicillium mononematosum]